MASVNSISPPQRLLHLPKPINQYRLSLPIPAKGLSGSSFHFSSSQYGSPRSKLFGVSQRNWRVGAVADDLDVIPVQSSDSTDQQEGGAAANIVREEEVESVNKVGGFSNEGRFSFESGVAGTDFQGFSSSAATLGEDGVVEDFEKLVDRAINTGIVLAAGTFAITKLLTIDRDYWHGWTLYEILRYAPLHNWAAYEEALKTNPVLAKMMISGVVYALGDWIAQCYEGKPLFEFDRARMFRSSLVGFSFHGSLSHYYYQLCEAVFPFDDWWVVPAKVVFDQTIWAAVWNSIYYVLLGFLRFESRDNIFNELKATFWPLLTAGWKLWPFAHLITYGLIPVEQRLLWVDCVELVWVTILSTYSNEKSEARTSEKSVETTSIYPSSNPKE